MSKKGISFIATDKNNTPENPVDITLRKLQIITGSLVCTPPYHPFLLEGFNSNLIILNIEKISAEHNMLIF